VFSIFLKSRLALAPAVAEEARDSALLPRSGPWPVRERKIGSRAALAVFVISIFLLSWLVYAAESGEVQLFGAPNEGAPPSTPPPRPTDLVIVLNVTINYAGYEKGYFGPATASVCGEARSCPTSSSGPYEVGPRTYFHWNVSFSNLDPNASHWVELFTVGVPFTLQDVYPETPTEICPGCAGPSFEISALSPSYPGAYYFTVTLVTFD
jgi:hypothetical protein